MTDDYVLNMSPHRFNSLYEAMDIMEAQEQLRDMIVSDWPNLKPKRRNEILRSLEKRANKLKPKRTLEFSAEALKELIGGR